MRRNISLYLKYISAVAKSTMQYRTSFFLMIIGRFLVDFGGFLGIYFLFSTFEQIKDYTYGEVLLCFSTMRLSFAIAECIGSGFAAFSGTVKRGEFDRILVRPVSPILQVLGTRFELGRVGPMMAAVVMLIMGIRSCQVTWTVTRVCIMTAMVLGGILLFIGLFMIGAAVCFFWVEESGCINVLTYGAKEHGKYPIDVYGGGMMRLCTYIIPYTLVQYYPLQYVLGRSDRWQYGLYPAGVLVFLAACYGFWRVGMAHYKSSGS